MNAKTAWPGPLAGLRILEVGGDLSAAFGSRTLYDLGAEIIKVEPAEGDRARRIGPFNSSAAGRGESAFFGYLNRGKRGVCIDTASDDGAALLTGLALRCDAVIADAASYRLLSGRAALPPSIVVSPFGLDQTRPSTNFITQFAGGFAFHQASPVTTPETTPPIGCADWESALAPGLVVASATLWAIAAADGAEPAPVVDIAAADVMTYLLVEPFAAVQAGEFTANRKRDPARGLTIAGGLVWLLPCSDGNIMVSPREDHQWERWLDVMGRPEWSADASLCAGRETRTRNAAELQRRMAEWSIGEKAQDLARRAQDNRVACFPVSTPLDLLNNAQLRHRDFFDEMAFADGSTVQMPGLPFIFKTEADCSLPRRRRHAMMGLGEDNGAVPRGAPLPETERP